MMGRPTFTEHLFYNRKTFVRSNSGSYFTAVNFQKAKALHLGIFSVFIAVMLAIHIFLTISGPAWPTRIIDFLVLANLGNLLCLFPHYRITRYEPIPENSEAYAHASALKYPSKAAVIAMSLLGVLLLLAALQSTGAAYVRYWLNGEQRITEASIEFHSKTDLKAYAVDDFAEGDSVIYIPASSGVTSAAVSVTTSGSPEPLQLTLDGKAARVFANHELRWFWDADYFVQCGYIDYAQVRDGSTLTLTCGDLTREWVFDVDEETS